MSRAIIIVDPQCDFVDGTLPVPGAPDAMKALAEHIERETYDLIIVTCDDHPWNHCSFNTEGGKWPPHCRMHTTGAAIWPPLASTLAALPGIIHILPKGRNPEKEEYSIWQAEDSALVLDKLLRQYDPACIDICGLAGDICVLTTLGDAIKRHNPGKFRILRDFSPSLDGGNALMEFCAKEGVCAR